MSQRMSVRATQPGIYENRRLNAGDVFVVEEEFFSETWMQKIVAEPVVVPAPEGQERRAEERDPGEHEQNLAKEEGLTS